jgi:hypothetical protein
MQRSSGLLNTLEEVAKSFGGQQYLASSHTLNLTKPEPVIYAGEHFRKKYDKRQK